jgi:hypothetical protein
LHLTVGAVDQFDRTPGQGLIPVGKGPFGLAISFTGCIRPGRARRTALPAVRLIAALWVGHGGPPPDPATAGSRSGRDENPPALASVPASLEAVTTTAVSPTTLSVQCSVSAANGTAGSSTLIAIPTA